MGEALEVAKVLVKPTIKLLDMVGGAIGTLYEPKHKRKMADATAYEINVIGEAMRGAADLPIVYDQNGVVINSEDFARLMQRAGTRLAIQETIKQHNIESVVDNAYEILEKEEVCSEEPVKQGWINRFFDSVADVSDEDLQKLWGKVLAGEIKRPGSFSLRTLDTIRNLATNEAKLFQKVLPFVMCLGTTEAFISSDKEILKKYNISYDDILELDEAGLVKSKGLRTTLTIIPHKPLCISNKNYTLVFWNEKEQIETIDVSNYALTKAGFELFSLLSVDENLEYDCMLAEQLVKANSNKVRISVNKINSKSKDSVNFVATPIESYGE